MAFILPTATTTRFHGLRVRNTGVSNTRVRRGACAVRPTPRMTATQLSQFDSLRAVTTIVEDTGEIELIRDHRPHSATTNPSLVANAARKPEYAHLVDDAVRYGRDHGDGPQQALNIVRNKLFTLFGAEILRYVPGDVSTEVDARLSFDVDAQVAVAEQLIHMYDQVGVPKERVLIKLATTWEGVEACRQLQNKGIKCNMTLLFSMAQAAAAAEAGAYLISPFVGRITDWYKKDQNVDHYPPESDPGVKSVRDIYNYYKCMGYETIVMGASFRNKDQILALAGCDRLTIAPKFITDLKATEQAVTQHLVVPSPDDCPADMEKLELDEAKFRWLMNEDPMATEKLAHGIRSFASDLDGLDRQLEKMI